MRFGSATLSLYFSVSSARGWSRGGFQGRESALDDAESLGELLDALGIGASQVADRLREPRRRPLTAAGDLIAGDLPAADDVVEQLLGPAAGPGRRIGGCGESPLDRGA